MSKANPAPNPAIAYWRTSDAHTTADHTLQRVEFVDVAVRLLALLGLVLVGGVIGWTALPQLSLGFAYLGACLVAAALAFAALTALARGKRVGVALACACAAVEGLLTGWISRALTEIVGDGLVTQALLATAITFAAAIGIAQTPWGQRVGRATRAFGVAVLGALGLSLVNLVLILTGVFDGWGLFGLGILGIGLCLAFVLLAAWSVTIDVTAVRDQIGQPAPPQTAWALALGLTISLVWLYMEFVRLFAIFRS